MEDSHFNGVWTIHLTFWVNSLHGVLLTPPNDYFEGIQDLVSGVFEID